VLALGGSGVTRPQTLVSVRGQIGAFAQDGNSIAWLSSSPRCSRLVELRNLATGAQSALASKRGATCRRRARMGVSPMLALAGRRALWGLYRTPLSHQLLTLVTGAAGGRDRVVAELEADCDACRAAPVLLHAGDGPTLAYSWSGINRVAGARAVKVREAYPAAFLAVAGTSVAFARYLGSDYAAGPRWSPNGKQLAFTSGRDYGSPSLYLTSPTGKRITNLTGSSYVVTPAWAPTGAALAYVAAGRAKWALWRIDPATRTRKELANDAVAGVRPAWSPNGYTVAFSRQDATATGSTPSLEAAAASASSVPGSTRNGLPTARSSCSPAPAASLWRTRTAPAGRCWPSQAAPPASHRTGRESPSSATVESG
jgi:WD40 repeat protein